MTLQQIEELIQNLTARGIQFEKGLTREELLEIEQKFDLHFPPDVKQFIQTSLPISKDFYNWRAALTSTMEADRINSMISWPLHGILFDIENNDVWLDQWGQKPNSLNERFRIAKANYLTYPKLVPIYSHRYISSEPNVEGNPVFSVYQMDIIYYGYDLASYLSKEFSFSLSDNFDLLQKPKNNINFWSWCVENN